MFQILPGKLDDPDVISLLQEHSSELQSVSPAESCHVLDLTEFDDELLELWCAFVDGQLAGCVALKQLDHRHGEIKSMRTRSEFRGRGIAGRMLDHMIRQAQNRGLQRLSLETGSMDFFAAARRLNEKFGFANCEPFDGYKEDPNSVCMTLILSQI